MAWADRLLSITETAWQGGRMPGNAMEIVEVFPGSIAEAAGLRPGMLYLKDERDKSATEWTALTARAETGRLVSRFVDLEASILRTVESVGFPWGIRLDQSHYEFVREVLDTYVNPTRFAARLLDSDDVGFDEMTNAALRRAVSPSLKQRFVKGVLSLLGRRQQLEPVIDFQRAIAAIASARKQDPKLARRLMPPLNLYLLHEFGSGAGAMSLYAEAMVAKSEGRSHDDVVKALRNAHDLKPTSKRIADALTAHGEPTVATSTHTIARPFSSDYCLPVADALEGPLQPADLAARPHLRLGESLAQLRPDQLGVVIMLGSYRVNGPYCWLIENLGHIYDLMSERLPFLHVVSSLDQVRNQNVVDQWKGGELHARTRGVPITVLHDYGNAVADALEITTSPVMFLLTREGTILFKGNAADDEPFWSALERLDGLRRAERAWNGEGS